jgi:preprotein translocase subunit Sec61beta
MAKEKKSSGSLQAAGLIRYFDEESEDAIQISKGSIYAICIIFSVGIYLANYGVWSWMWATLGL